uniref:RNA helicase n=1 Tax=Cyprinus carpio carpio TaxID=630221 RepID=A0A9J8B2L2_CYPCA
MVLRVTPATCPWTPQTSGLHVYCTSTRTTTQKYKLKLTHSLRRKGYGVGPTQKYKSALTLPWRPPDVVLGMSRWRVSRVVFPCSSKSPDQAGKQQADSAAGRKRDADSDAPDELLLGKRQKLETVSAEEINLSELMPKVKAEQVETVEGCTHEVVLPADEEYTPLKPRVGKAAKEYPFILDSFQREAILCLDNNQSVLVSAHTSAGKTIYMVDYFDPSEFVLKFETFFFCTQVRHCSGSPRKAASDLHQPHQSSEQSEVQRDVRRVPGSCYPSMLYRGSEVMREVAWVIFDEIHYMRDSERGVVWEETIILLPDNVHHVFLSATIPNARQFAEWICHLHKQPCHVVYTDYRPTPLQHYIFPAGGDGLHLVVDENGEFREDNFNTAMQVLRDAGDTGGNAGGPSNVFKIVKMIMERNFQPVIIFSFSKKECEAYALQVAKLDFNTDDEKKLVEEVFNNATDCLSDEDKKLPQVEHVLPLLKRGIGIHHGGLLPILKETIEILFSEGLIKALFATETFAMGINMPARTVLFTSARKFDGKDFRWITSGEYIQMSGRAGRRGMDERGIVIFMVDEKMSPAVGKQLLKGSADPLNSAFHLTYNMVLNLLRVEEINPEYMLEKSFYQFQHYRAVPGVVEKMKKLEEEYNAIRIPNEESMVTYYKIRQQLAKLSKEIEEFIHKPRYCLPFLQPGRLVMVKKEDLDFGWGIVVSFHKKTNVKAAGGDADPLFVVEVLLHCSKDSVKNAATEAAKPPGPGEKGEMQVVPVILHLITSISSVRLYIPKDLRPYENRQSMLKSIQEVQKRFPDGVPLLDPIDDMGIKDPALKKVIQKVEAFEHRMFTHPLHSDPNLEAVYTLCEKKALVKNKILLSNSSYFQHSGSFLNHVVLLCVHSADELLLTEMVFNGLFNDLTAEQATALLSCFVFQENANEMPKLTEQLAGPLRQMQECAKRIAKVSAEAKLDVDEDTYLNQFRPHLMDVVYTWANGSSFSQICKMTDVFEGSIIRCMRRLEELLRQMCQAAKAIGNTELENKFATGITKIKRDIVFAASLYL